MGLGMILTGLINGIGAVSSGVTIADALQKKFGKHSLEFQLYCALDNALRDLCEQQGWEHDPAVVASVLSSEQVKTVDLSDEEQLRSILEVFIGVSQIVSAEVQDEWIECFDRQVAQFPELYRYLDRKNSAQKSKPNTSAAKTLTIIPEALDLFGREKAVSDILENLKSADIVCIHAGGGVGKTAVAAVVMDEIRKNSCEEDNGFSHFAWLTSTGSLKNDLILLNIPTSMERSTETEKLNAVIKFLQENPTFLVIDNMDSLPARDDRSLLNTLKGKTKILITSRIPLSNLKSYSLEDLNPDSALELFYRCYLGDNEQAAEELKLRKDAEFAKKILDKAGYNALLIELIGKMASWEYRGKLGELWEKLKDNIFLASSEIDIDDTEHSASHRLSENDLKLQDHICKLYALSGLSKERQEIMNFMAQFPAEMNVFREILDWAGFNIDDLKWLVERAWIEQTEEGLLLHTMVKGSVWKQGIGFNIWQYEKLIEKLAYTDNYMPVTVGYVTVRKKLNTVNALGVLIANGIEAKLVNVEGSFGLLNDVGTFLNNLAAVYQTQGNYEEALKYYRKALDIYKKVLEEEHPNTASTYNNLAGVYQDQGKYEEALKYYDKALEIREKVLGEEHPDTAGTYNNLGNVYRILGNYEEALKYYEKALEIIEKVLGEEHPDTAPTYNNLALVYADLGNYEEALKYYEKALEIREKVLGEEHPDTAGTYNNLAIVYADQGKYEEALKYFEKALEIREKMLGEEHPDTAGTYNNLGNVYQTQGKYEEALKYHRKALAIRERVLGEEHPDTATTYNNLGNVYQAQGNCEDALKYHGKALSIREKVLGEEHPDTASTYNNLALVYADQGDYEKALKYHRKALAIRERVLGEEHPDTATTYNSLAIMYKSQGKNEEALKYQRKAMEIRKIVLGEEHPDTATTYYNMGVLFFRFERL